MVCSNIKNALTGACPPPSTGPTQSYVVPQNYLSTYVTKSTSGTFLALPTFTNLCRFQSQSWLLYSRRCERLSGPDDLDLGVLSLVVV